MRKVVIAFTLVEILVCIAIIALLAAIIHSVYLSSKDKARQAICLSNMRQIHQAVSLYRQDYDGADSGTRIIDMGLPLGMEGLNLWGYVKNKETMFCPNRFITEHGRIVHTKSFWSYRDYSIYKRVYNFPKKYQEDSKWPLFFCEFEDINYLRKYPNKDPQFVSASTLDGTIYRFDYNKILKLFETEQKGILDESYRQP